MGKKKTEAEKKNRKKAQEMVLKGYDEDDILDALEEDCVTDTESGEQDNEAVPAPTEEFDPDEFEDAWENFYERAAKRNEAEKNVVVGYNISYQNKVLGKKKVMKSVYLYCPECGREITYPGQKTCPGCGAVLSTASKANEESKTEESVEIKPGATGGKTFVLDTNVIISSYGQVLTGFDDNEVIITHTTMEELDKFKDESSERGYATREAIRYLKALNEENGGNIQDGIPVNNGGLVRMETGGVSEDTLPKGWSITKPDNMIISAAISLKRRKNPNTFLITNDSIMSFKASAIPDGVIAQSYHNDIVINEMEKPYTGRQEAEIGQVQITQLYRDKAIQWKKDATENEYYVLKCGTSSALGKYRDGMMHLVEHPNISSVRPKNAGQSFALDALLAPADEIPLVIIKGSAGSGKTHLAVAAGLEGAYVSKKHRVYERVIISRSNTIPEKEDLGFLPGGIEEKMDPLLQPFYYSMKKVISRGEWEDPRQIELQMEELLDRYVQIQPLAYIRGITVDNAFLIIDEAQNLSRAQVKTIITRMGVNSKLVLLGDPEQIDSPKLSRNTNGLVYAAEKFKGCPLCAQITFDSERECLRGPLSAYAVEVL